VTSGVTAPPTQDEKCLWQCFEERKMDINSTEMIKENDGAIKSGSLDRRTHV